MMIASMTMLCYLYLDFNFELVLTNVQSTFVSISYTVNPSEGVVGRANITAVYTGSCSGQAPQTTILNGLSSSYTISNLQEFSPYTITVTLDLTFGRTGVRNVDVVTQGIGEHANLNSVEYRLLMILHCKLMVYIKYMFSKPCTNRYSIFMMYMLSSFKRTW